MVDVPVRGHVPSVVSDGYVEQVVDVPRSWHVLRANAPRSTGSSAASLDTAEEQF